MKKRKFVCFVSAIMLLALPVLSACNNDLQEPFLPYDGYQKAVWDSCSGEHQISGEPTWYYNTDRAIAYAVFNCSKCDDNRVIEALYEEIPSTSTTGLLAPELSNMRTLTAQVNVDGKAYSDTSLVVSTHTQKQSQFLTDDNSKVFMYANGSTEASHPEAVTVSWESVKGYSKYQIRLSDESDIDDDDVVATVTDTSFALENLETGKTYYCQIIGKKLFGKCEGDVLSFKTSSSTPRNLKIDGVTNARDLGGYITSSGRIVKQGLIYRTASLDSLKTDKKTYKAGINAIEQLGIKTQIDLRGNDNDDVITDPLGKMLDYYYFPMTTSSLKVLETEGNLTAMKNIIETLANKANLPAVFHCSIGTDRTGYVAFMLNALLGVSQGDLYYDYMFSCFGKIGGSRKNDAIDYYIDMLSDFSEAETLQQQAYDYLENKVGIHPFYLDHFIENMLY